MNLKKTLGVFFALGLGATLLAPTHHTTIQARAARASRKISFASPSIVDPVHTYGEPDVRVNQAFPNDAYISGPWGTGTQRSIWNRSTDGGRTFLALHGSKITSPDQSATDIPLPNHGPPQGGGGDTEISIDNAGNVYYADLAALASLKTAIWKEPQCKPAGCPDGTLDTGAIAQPQQNLNGLDRQWFATWDPTDVAAARAASGYTGKFPVNYLVYLEALGASGCPAQNGNCEDATYSMDGVNYSAPTVVADIGLDGNAVVDQQTGTVLEAVGVTGLGDVGVAEYTRGKAAANDPSLTKVDITKIATLPSGTNARALFPVIALDSNRTAYITWVTRNPSGTTSKQDPKSWQIFYSYATAASGWKQWSAPRQVSAPPANTNVMPWITAGSKGRIAIVYYGTNDSTHDPSQADAHQAWNVYLANITKADSASPKIQQVSVTDHPMHYGTICLEGTGCIAVAGNRNLADFFQVETNPKTGALEITYDDTSNDITQSIQNGASVPDSAADHKGAPIVTLAVQNGGIGLFGKPITGPPRRSMGLKDPSNDAMWDPIYGGAKTPSLDVRGLSEYRHAKKLIVRLKVSDLSKISADLSSTGAAALDWVVRWSGFAKKGETSSNPIFYMAAESSSSGQTFYGGKAITVDLCSVSGCFPHAIDYPSPPLGGKTIKNAKMVITKGPASDYFQFTVPSKRFHARRRSLFESFGAYSFASPRQSNQPPSNSEGEADIFPVTVDGICCREAVVRRR